MGASDGMRLPFARVVKARSTNAGRFRDPHDTAAMGCASAHQEIARKAGTAQLLLTAEFEYRSRTAHCGHGRRLTFGAGLPYPCEVTMITLATAHCGHGRRLTLFWLTLLLPAGCGHVAPTGASVTPDGGAEGDVSSTHAGAVIGTMIDVSITEKGESSAPLNRAGVSLAALVPQPGGGFLTITGNLNPDGSFEIPGVPEGPYYLSVVRAPGDPPSFVVTTERELDLGVIHAGRADALLASTSPTSLVLRASGLAPWQDTDGLELFSLGSASFAHLEYQATVATGATSLDALTVDASLFDNPALMDASRGDTAILTQLVTQTAGDVVYQAVGRAFAPPPFSQADGLVTSISGAFAPVPQSRVSVDWKRTLFAGLAHDVNPAATVSDCDIDAYVEPGNDRVTFSLSPDLLLLMSPDATDVSLDLGYGNPYPASWAVVGMASATYATALSPTVTVYASVGVSAVLATLVGGPIKPQMSPPRSLTIGGANAYATLTGVGLTPTVAWGAPALGSPTLYTVTVWQLDAMGQSTWRGAVATSETSVTLPPGLLVSGAQHYLTVRAELDSGFTLKAPFKFYDTDVYAEGLTALFTP
jgi:hypothetical protein